MLRGVGDDFREFGTVVGYVEDSVDKLECSVSMVNVVAGKVRFFCITCIWHMNDSAFQTNVYSSWMSYKPAKKAADINIMFRIQTDRSTLLRNGLSFGCSPMVFKQPIINS